MTPGPNVTPMGLPVTSEYAEASQASTNERKAAYRATLSPEENARLDTIEGVTRQLEEAQIPFLLFADSVPFAESTKRGCFWQYNRMGYEPDWDQMRANAQSRMTQLMEVQLKTLSRMCHGTFVWVSPDGQPIYAARASEGGYIKEGGDGKEGGL